MRAYLGVTGHYMEPGHLQLRSSLLSCERFCGSHTGERIAAELVAVLALFKLEMKVDYFITDNAANMRKALTTVLAHCDEEYGEQLGKADEAALENTELWQDIDEVDNAEINELLTSKSRNERLSCFDHSLHIAVGDGLKSTKCVSSAVTKCCKISSLLHASTLFRDAFEKVFGSNKSSICSCNPLELYSATVEICDQS